MNYEVMSLMHDLPIDPVGYGPAYAKRVQVGHRIVLLIRFEGDDRVYSTQPHKFDIRQERQVNVRMRQAWCRLLKVSYGSLLAEVLRMRAAERAEGDQQAFDELCANVMLMTAPPMTPSNRKKLSKMQDSLAGLQRVGKSIPEPGL